MGHLFIDEMEARPEDTVMHAFMHHYLSLSQLPRPSRLRDETTAPEPLTDLAHHSINWSDPSFHSLRLVWCLVRKCHPAEVNPHLVVFSPSSRTLSHSLSLLHSRLMPPPSLFPVHAVASHGGNCCRRSLSLSLLPSLSPSP